MSDSEQLVLLIRSAREDASVREPLLKLLALDDAAAPVRIAASVFSGASAPPPR